MQEILSLFIVFSFMFLFFGASMNIYHAYFSDVVLASDDIHISDDKIIQQKKTYRQGIKKGTIAKEKQKDIEYSSLKQKRNRNSALKSSNKPTESKTYTKKCSTYKEFKKYNSISR